MQEVGRYSGPLVPRSQLERYADIFGFTLTPSNEEKVRQIVFSARAEACSAADRVLGQAPGDLSRWVDEALAAKDPFLFDETPDVANAEHQVDTNEPTSASPASPLHASPEHSLITQDSKSTILLNTAIKAYIAAYEAESPIRS